MSGPTASPTQRNSWQGFRHRLLEHVAILTILAVGAGLWSLVSDGGLVALMGGAKKSELCELEKQVNESLGTDSIKVCPRDRGSSNLPS